MPTQQQPSTRGSWHRAPQKNQQWGRRRQRSGNGGGDGNHRGLLAAELPAQRPSVRGRSAIGGECYPRPSSPLSLHHKHNGMATRTVTSDVTLQTAAPCARRSGHSNSYPGKTETGHSSCQQEDDGAVLRQRPNNTTPAAGRTGSTADNDRGANVARRRR